MTYKQQRRRRRLQEEGGWYRLCWLRCFFRGLVCGGLKPTCHALNSDTIVAASQKSMFGTESVTSFIKDVKSATMREI